MSRAVAAVLLAASVNAGAGPVALFDGHSLAGWRADEGIEWAVEEGAIVASGRGDGFLGSDAQYGDFYLKAEFWVDATTNSGIFIRCTDRGRIHPDTCYELNIWDQHPQQEARTGAIVFRFMPPMAQVATVGRWSTLEVMARGASIEVKVNGETTAVLKNADPTPGFIALQHFEEGTVKFRSLRLEERQLR